MPAILAYIEENGLPARRKTSKDDRVSECLACAMTWKNA